MEPLSVPMAAVLGFLTGIVLATIRHFSHDHPGYSPAALVEHFIPHLITTAFGCAVVFALATTILNRLRRNR
jgi:hypothetical protein